MRNPDKMQGQKYSRSVHPKNLRGKQGNTFKNNNTVNKVPKKFNKPHVNKLSWKNNSTHELGDVVVRAGPPKDFDKRTIVFPEAMRYTIPNSPKNKNIYEQMYVRTHLLKMDLTREIENLSKIKLFATDDEHVEMIN